MKKSLRILSLLLALVFLLSLAPIAAFADGEDGQLTEEELLRLRQEEEERRRREEQEAAAAAARQLQAAPALAAAPVVSVPAPVGQTEIPDNPAGTTVDEVKSDEEMGTNNGAVTTNEGSIGTNNGTVTTNEAGGKIDTNNGTVTTNEGEININTGTVNGGTVKYNAGGTVNNGTVENNGYGVKLNNFDGNTARNFYGTGVVANSDKTAAFVPKKTSDLEVVFQHQDGCDMNIDSGGVGYRYVYNAGVWMVSFDEVVNNLKIFFTKAVDREPTLEEQYMDFIYSVARKIREAKKDSTVEIDAGYWLSYRTEVFQALADRPDVSLKTTYRRDGKTMRFTIPAGTDVLTAVYPEVVVEYPKLAELLHITPEQVK